jgi:ankyrin repeat protein
VLFFFFRQIVEKNHTAKYLVRDFAAQLLPHSPALVTALLALSQEYGISGIELDIVWPALLEALKHGGPGGKPVFCVVDALDEMDDGEFEGMVEKLVALGTSTVHQHAVRLMMTSRPLPHIQQALAHPDVMRLKLDPALLSPDVDRYVQARMAKLDPPLSPDKHELVGQTICERANGLFLQARLVTDNLAEALQDGRVTEETLPDSLDRLPRTLRAVYEDLLKEHARRSGVSAEDQAKILMCVTHASRPLRLIELGSLLSRMLGVDLRRGKELVRAGCGRLLELLEDETVSVIHHSFTEFLHDASRKDDRDCAFPVLEDEASHAMLAVLLLEYLNGCPHVDTTIDDNREANYEDRDFYGPEGDRRRKMRTRIRVEHPLAAYAVDNTFFHMSKTAPGHPATDQLLEALDRYLMPGQAAFENMVIMDWDGPLSASFSVLHLVTALRKGDCIPKHVMDHLVERDRALLDSRDPDGITPLSYAAKNGHTLLAAILLAKGADATAGSNDGRKPLHRAARKGHAGVVRLLLNAGVDPLIKTDPVLRSYNRYEQWYEEYTEEEAEEHRETALSHAFMGDDPEVVKAFMPFVPPDEINSCFHRVDKLENIKTVLETGKVDIDSYMDGRTKLYRAVHSMDLDVVKLLLQHGADPNRRSVRERFHETGISSTIPEIDSARGPAPLHAFGPDRYTVFDSRKEDVAECIRLLIDAGADVNATMDSYYEHSGLQMTPLHLAVQRKEDLFGGSWGSMDESEETLAEILLSVGADPNAKSKRGNTPLHLANTEKPGVVELLIQHGADVNAANARGRTPLLEMINRLPHDSSERLKPNIKVLEMLLDCGADVNVTDDNGGTVFHYILHSISNMAANPESIPFIKRLMGAGADLNKTDKKGRPPLFSYHQCSSYWTAQATYHDEEMLRMLVDAGMDINSRDDDGRSILWVVGERYSVELEVFKKFVRLGADPRAVANDGRTLLHLAVEHSRPPEWFRYLISEGVKPDVLRKDGDSVIDTVLRKTGRYGRYEHAREVIQILTEEAAVPPPAKNGKSQSALHVAGSLENLEIALNHPAFRGLDVNEPDIDGFTPFHHAVALGQKGVWTLLRAGADPTLLTPRSLSPLHVAARSGEAGVVGLLLAQYRELNVLEKHVNLLGEGRVPLHYACQSGSPEAVWSLLRDGADPRLPDEKGLTPLHALAEFEAKSSPPPMADIIAMLHRAGVNLNAEAAVQTEDQTSLRMLTPLDVAVERRCWATVRALLACGVEPRDSHRQSADFVLATDKDKAAEEARKAQASVPQPQDSSSYHRSHDWRGRWAAGPGAEMPPKEETRFLAGGQDILDLPLREADDKDNDVNDALRGALRDGDYDTIKEYVQLGGDVIKPRGWRHDTFLHYLIEEGQAELLEYFGDKVAEFEAQQWVQKDEEGETDEEDKDICGMLLDNACAQSRPSLRIIQLLVDKLGVNVNAANYPQGSSYKRRGAAPLHILAGGAEFWHVEALEYLLSKGADIEARNSAGMTPLLAAIDKREQDGFWKEQAVRVLLKHGADVNATFKKEPGDRERSALEMSGHAGVTKLLLEHGASVDSCPGLLTRAIREWMEPGVVTLLLEAGLDPNELPPSEREPKKGKESNESERDDEEAGQDEDAAEEQPNLDLRYALHEAARPSTAYYPPSDLPARQQAVIEVLISHGADAYASYPDGRYVLQAIVEDRGEVDCILPRLPQTKFNRKSPHQRTLLISACIPTVPVGPDFLWRKTGSAPTIMPNAILTLLDAGADPLAVDDEEGRTPLHWFCTLPGKDFDEAHRNAFVALARHGPAAVHMTDKQGRKPLHLAMETYSSGAQVSPFVIQHLLSVGVDPADPDPMTGNSALHFIAPRLVGEATAAAEATTVFRNLAARLDINARNKAGETPVFAFAAASWEDRHSVKQAQALDVFVEFGADLMAVDGKKRTLLHVTAGREWKGSQWSEWELREDITATYKKLLGLAVDPRAEDDQLRTSIDIAVAGLLDGIVKLFSEDGKREREREEKEEDDGGSDGEGGDSA